MSRSRVVCCAGRGRGGGGLERGNTRVTLGKYLIMMSIFSFLTVCKGFGVLWFGESGA